MALFDVTFDGMGFMEHSELDNAELSAEFLAAFNETMTAENSFPPGVVAVVSASASADESQSDEEEMKFFIPIVLTVEANSEDDAWDLEPPEDLLTKIVDAIPDLSGSNLDGTWEVLNVSDSELEPQPKKQGPKGPK